MVNNSIRSNLTKTDVISELKLALSADVERQKVYIIVEGENDIKFMRAYETEDVLFFESYDGKNGVEYIVNVIYKDNERVIGIRDKDYQIAPVSKKIFYYDYNCLEMMIISHDDVFENLCYEYYEGIVKNRELKVEILRQLKFFSIIRMHNEREQWGINLSCVSLNKAWDEERHEVNNNKIVEKINLANSKFIDKNLLDTLQSEYEQEWDEYDYYDYTQGHDFFQLFSIECNQYRSKKKGINYSDVEASARCSFRSTNMIKTNFYNNIREYAKNEKLNILSIECDGKGI